MSNTSLAKKKFPNPNDYPPNSPAVLCPAGRVIGLYNQDSGDTAKRLAKKVRKWFADVARAKGWAGIHFLPEVESNHGAGCVLWRPPQQINLQIVVTKHTLVLTDDTDQLDDADDRDDPDDAA